MHCPNLFTVFSPNEVNHFRSNNKKLKCSILHGCGCKHECDVCRDAYFELTTSEQDLFSFTISSKNNSNSNNNNNNYNNFN